MKEYKNIATSSLYFDCCKNNMTVKFLINKLKDFGDFNFKMK